MILTGLFPPDAPGRCGRPGDKALAIEGKGLSGRDTGKDGAVPSDREGRGVVLETSGDDAYGLTEAGLRVEGPADIAMIAGRAEGLQVSPRRDASDDIRMHTHFWSRDGGGLDRMMMMMM